MAHLHAPGLVLRMDAQTLAADGATYTGSGLEDVEFAAHQYYVCIESNAKDALWVPLFAAPGPSRKGIAAASKTGNTRWVRYTSFYDSGQLCRIPHKATQHAASAAYDDSTPKAPNRMDPGHLPGRAEFPDDAAFRPMMNNVAIR